MAQNRNFSRILNLVLLVCNNPKHWSNVEAEITKAAEIMISDPDFFRAKVLPVMQGKLTDSSIVALLTTTQA
jgi:hypothetical protein